MIFLFGMVVGIIYGITRYLCRRSFKRSIWIICSFIMVTAIIVACMSDDAVVIATMIGLGIMLSFVVFIVCADAEHTVENKEAYKSAIKEQKAQEKYDNEWGYIRSANKKK